MFTRTDDATSTTTIICTKKNSQIFGRDNMPKCNIHLLMTLYTPHEHPVNDHANPNPMQPCNCQVRNHCPSMTFASTNIFPPPFDTVDGLLHDGDSHPSPLTWPCPRTATAVTGGVQDVMLAADLGPSHTTAWWTVVTVHTFRW